MDDDYREEEDQTEEGGTEDGMAQELLRRIVSGFLLVLQQMQDLSDCPVSIVHWELRHVTVSGVKL